MQVNLLQNKKEATVQITSQKEALVIVTNKNKHVCLIEIYFEVSNKTQKL